VYLVVAKPSRSSRRSASRLWTGEISQSSKRDQRRIEERSGRRDGRFQARVRECTDHASAEPPGLPLGRLWPKIQGRQPRKALWSCRNHVTLPGEGFRCPPNNSTPSRVANSTRKDPRQNNKALGLRPPVKMPVRETKVPHIMRSRAIGNVNVVVGNKPHEEGGPTLTQEATC